MQVRSATAGPEGEPEHPAITVYGAKAKGNNLAELAVSAKLAESFVPTDDRIELFNWLGEPVNNAVPLASRLSPAQRRGWADKIAVFVEVFRLASL